MEQKSGRFRVTLRSLLVLVGLLGIVFAAAVNIPVKPRFIATQSWFYKGEHHQFGYWKEPTGWEIPGRVAIAVPLTVAAWVAALAVNHLDRQRRLQPIAPDLDWPTNAAIGILIAGLACLLWIMIDRYWRMSYAELSGFTILSFIVIVTIPLAIRGGRWTIVGQIGLLVPLAIGAALLFF